MDAWIEFWKYACLIGFGSFCVLALVIAPLGARDLVRLFRHLGRREEGPGESDDAPR